MRLGVAALPVRARPDVLTDGVVDWLADGDPAIRWQVMRDLLDERAEARMRRAGDA